MKIGVGCVNTCKALLIPFLKLLGGIPSKVLSHYKNRFIWQSIPFLSSYNAVVFLTVD